MKIDVITAIENCALYCNKFEVKVQPLYADDRVYKRVYKCEHLEECLAMEEAKHTANDTVTIYMDDMT